MNIRTVYGIHDVPNIIFLSLEAAQEYIFTENPGDCWSKDSLIDYCDREIWEDNIKTCEGCGTKILYSDIDSDWVRTEGCCGGCSDVWLCGCRH